MNDFSKAKADYIRGVGSIPVLAKKHGIPPSTLQKRCTSEGWVELKAQHGAKVEAILVDSAAKETAAQSFKIAKVADTLLERLSEIATGSLSTRGLQELASALKTLKDVMGVKNDIDLREQEIRIQKLKKDIEAETSGGKVIKVIFNDDDGDDIDDYTV